MKDLNLMGLDMAHRYAMTCSGCTKVQVGSIIAKDRRIISCGANRTIPRLCDSLAMGVCVLRSTVIRARSTETLLTVVLSTVR